MATVKSVFIDTSAWYALSKSTEMNHERARAFMADLFKSYGRIVTTNLVVGETYTLIRSRIDYERAWRFLRAIRDTGRLARVFVSERLEGQAYELLKQFRDTQLSYVDATSLAVMGDLGISDCFGFDRHFAAAGFVLVPAS